MRTWCGMGAALLFAWPLAARGSRATQDTPEQIAGKVRKHLKSAKTHFKVGEFGQAATEWRRAYKLEPIAPLLFDIAQACRLNGDYEQARFAYATYLQELPDAPNKAEVQKDIRLMTRYVHHPPKHGPKADSKVAGEKRAE